MCRHTLVLLFFLFTFLTFTSYAYAATFIDDDITEDTAWTQDGSPYVITFPITVVDGASLSIDSGVVVKFDMYGMLIVDGAIKALGTDTSPIYFTSLADDSIGGDTNDDAIVTTPSMGDWGEIVIESSSMSSVFNNVIEHYSDGGLLVFNTLFSSNTFASDNRLFLFSSHSLFTDLAVPKFTAFNASTVIINGGSIIGTDRFPFALYGGGSVSVSNMHVHSDTDQTIGVFDSGSSLSLDTVVIDGDLNSTSGIGVFGADLIAKNVSINNVANGISVYDDFNRGGSAAVTDSSIHCSGNGLSVYGDSSFSPNSSLDISGGSINCATNGIAAYTGTVSARGVTIEGASNAGIVSYDGSPMPITITKSEISNNDTGVAGYGANMSGSNNSIHDNTVGAFNADDSAGDLDFRNNYWGTATGPINLTTNPSGAGNSVSENISFFPWLHYDPLHPGVSNVLFIPGFEASRLYKKKHIPIIGDIEDKLWEPNANSDVVDMNMDDNGVSLNPDIYTRDIIDEKNVLGLSGGNVYKSFMADMDALVTNGTIAEWRATPYDWRLSPDIVVARGVARDDGTISYNEELENDQIPYIMDQLRMLIDTSKDGKVTIVTHSNGGLVAKALIKKLTEMKTAGANDWIDSIDRLIMVAAPQIGTPKAVASMLHGYDQSIQYGILLKQSIARAFGINLPGAYSLLPSKKYFDDILNPVITFDLSLDKVSNWRTLYGNNINSADTFTDFLLGIKDKRAIPGSTDLGHPIVGNAGLNTQSTAFHDSIDNFLFPATTKVYQLAGWGLPTVQSINYFGRKECTKILVGKCVETTLLDEGLAFIHDGDDTVVSPSALYNNDAKSYYLNLYQYNNKNNDVSNSVGHAQLFEIKSTIDFVTDILNGVSTLPQYITTKKPTNFTNLVLSLHISAGKAPVIAITDKNGKTTGIPKLTTATSISTDFISYLNQIPNSVYVQFGRTQYLILPKGGNYIVTISKPNTNSNSDESDTSNGGNSPSTFTLREDTLNEDDTIISSVSFPSISVTPDVLAEVPIDESGTMGDISVDTNGDGAVDAVIPPALDPENPNENRAGGDTTPSPTDTSQSSGPSVSGNSPIVYTQHTFAQSIISEPHSPITETFPPVQTEKSSSNPSINNIQERKHIPSYALVSSNEKNAEASDRNQIPGNTLVASAELGWMGDNHSLLLGIISTTILMVIIVLKFIFKVK